MPNRMKGERPFPNDLVQRVWEKARVIESRDPNEVRMDKCNAVIARREYGNVYSHTGWEIDHIKPLAIEGGDDISNLQPLQWMNNRHKGDNYPNWICKLGLK